jgi:hypothetical protein
MLWVEMVVQNPPKPSKTTELMFAFASAGKATKMGFPISMHASLLVL